MFNVSNITIQTPETLGDVIVILMAFLVGFIFGFIARAIFGKQNKSTEIMLSWLIAGIWLSMVVVSYPTGVPIPSYFNVLGFGCTGNIIGLNFSSLVSAFLKLKGS